MNSLVPVKGVTRDGDRVESVSIQGPDGMCAMILPLGARVVDLRLANGKSMVRAFHTLEEVEKDEAYHNVAVGRVANRIKGGKYGNVELDRNNGKHHIHGGRRGWDKKLWNITRHTVSSLVLSLCSPHCEQGYPACVEATIIYELRGDGEFYVEFITRNLSDIDTITNMTLHPYFDLCGLNATSKNSTLDYTLHAPTCDSILELDADNIPTGILLPVSNTRFDLRAPTTLRAVNATFDNYFISSHAPDFLLPVLHISAPGGASLSVLTNQPGFQLYTPSSFSSIAVEPSGYIDAPSNKHFPPITLRPNMTKSQRIVYKFT